MKPHLQTMLKEIESGEALLLDVREVDEWSAGHLELAVFCPLSDLQNGKQPPALQTADYRKTLYLHCRSGVRVHTAAPLLRAMGAGRVVPLSEGFAELVEHSFTRATP